MGLARLLPGAHPQIDRNSAIRLPFILDSGASDVTNEGSARALPPRYRPRCRGDRVLENVTAGTTSRQVAGSHTPRTRKTLEWSQVAPSTPLGFVGCQDERAEAINSLSPNLSFIACEGVQRGFWDT
jgi:hypothetical protein